MFNSEFYLADPIDPSEKKMIQVKSSYDINLINTCKKREIRNVSNGWLLPDTYYEKISLLAMEGSTVTLLGLVKYDTASNEF